MIRLRPMHRVVLGCVAAVMLPIAAGSLLGALLGSLLMATRPMNLASEESVTALSDAYNTSGQELFARFAAAPGNIVISPYSIGTAMALARSGAGGETEAEMARVLRHGLPRAEVDSANGKALATLSRYGRGSLFPNSGNATLVSANAVMLPPHGAPISTDYLARARTSYAAEIFRNADFADVNTWLSRKTEGKIDKIVDRLDPETAAILLNAVYFKAAWFDPFDPARTRAEPFAISPSQTVEVPMMRREGIFPVVTGAGFSAIRIPYQALRLHMVVVLPDHAGGLPELGARLDGAGLTQLLIRLRGDSFAHVELGLPRFRVKFEASLTDHFRALGMTEAFDAARADFSGMTGGSGGLFIKDVAHAAMIEVTEEGAEAAAATAEAMAVGRPQPFHVNRPFLFYVVESTTNAILFQGRIVDPR
jgi:serpin B